jgi:hypothetical protein
VTAPLPDPPQPPSDTSVRPEDGPQPDQDPGYYEVEADTADPGDEEL